MNWPHDAVLLPSASRSAALSVVEEGYGNGRAPALSSVNATAMSAAGREYRVFVAELDGKRVLNYHSAGANKAPPPQSMYG